MDMDKALMKKIEDAAYALVSLLEQGAIDRCRQEDTGGVHYLVSEASKIASLPRSLKARFDFK
jgi:hypothetical protein